jgi:hypothetical protein
MNGVELKLRDQMIHQDSVHDTHQGEPIVLIRKYYIWDKALPATPASLQTVATGNEESARK